MDYRIKIAYFNLLHFSVLGFYQYNKAVREKKKNQSTSNPIFSSILRLLSRPLQITQGK